MIQQIGAAALKLMLFKDGLSGNGVASIQHFFGAGINDPAFPIEGKFYQALVYNTLLFSHRKLSLESGS